MLQKLREINKIENNLYSIFTLNDIDLIKNDIIFLQNIPLTLGNEIF